MNSRALSVATLVKISRRIQDGEVVRFLAREYGVAATTLYRRLRRRGLPCWRFKGWSDVLSRSQRECWDLAQAGWNRREIAELTGRSVECVSAHISQARDKMGMDVRLRSDKPTAPPRVAQLRAVGLPHAAIAERLGISVPTSRNAMWRARRAHLDTGA